MTGVQTCALPICFCPVVAFTDGSAPKTFNESPFIKIADKSKGNDDIISKIEEVLKTEIPKIARLLHDELDRTGGSYLWEFLEMHWNQLNKGDNFTPPVLERLFRKRAAIQLGRLNPSSEAIREIENIEGIEFYICPPLSGEELRLGEIIQHKGDHTFRIILTPHCYLTVQKDGDRPKADHLLTLKTIPAKVILEKEIGRASCRERV